MVSRRGTGSHRSKFVPLASDVCGSALSAYGFAQRAAPVSHAVNDGVTDFLSRLNLTVEHAKVYSDLPDRTRR